MWRGSYCARGFRRGCYGRRPRYQSIIWWSHFIIEDITIVDICGEDDGACDGRRRMH